MYHDEDERWDEENVHHAGQAVPAPVRHRENPRREGTGTPGKDTAVGDNGPGVALEDSCTEVDRVDQEGQEVVHERHRALVALLHGCKAVVHFDRGDYQTDQQQELSHQDHRQRKPEQRQLARRLGGTSIAD